MNLDLLHKVLWKYLSSPAYLNRSLDRYHQQILALPALPSVKFANTRSASHDIFSCPLRCACSDPSNVSSTFVNATIQGEACYCLFSTNGLPPLPPLSPPPISSLLPLPTPRPDHHITVNVHSKIMMSCYLTLKSLLWKKKLRTPVIIFCWFGLCVSRQPSPACGTPMGHLTTNIITLAFPSSLSDTPSGTSILQYQRKGLTTHLQHPVCAFEL